MASSDDKIMYTSARAMYQYYLRRWEIKPNVNDYSWMMLEPEVIKMWPNQKARRENVQILLDQKSVDKPSYIDHVKLLDIYQNGRNRS